MSKIITPYHIGEKVEGQGIYAGIWRPKGRDDVSLGKVFNLFAAKQDSKGTATYNATIEKLAHLKNYDGYNGAQFTNDSELLNAIKDDKYNSEWFIPTKDILLASSLLGAAEITMSHGTLYDLRNQGSFKSTFRTQKDSENHIDMYWSSTSPSAGKSPLLFFTADFNDESGHSLSRRNSIEISSRLVRAAEITPATIALQYITLQKPLKLKPPVRFKS